MNVSKFFFLPLPDSFGFQKFSSSSSYRLELKLQKLQSSRFFVSHLLLLLQSSSSSNEISQNAIAVEAFIAAACCILMLPHRHLTKCRGNQLQRRLRHMLRRGRLHFYNWIEVWKGWGPQDGSTVYYRLISSLESENVVDVSKWFATLGLEELNSDDALKICYAIFVDKFLMGPEGTRPMRKLLWHMVEDLEWFYEFPWGTYAIFTLYTTSEMF